MNTQQSAVWTSAWIARPRRNRCAPDDWDPLRPLAARAKVHVQAKHRRNPTTTDKQIDADELWVRIGVKPELLERPKGTSLFVQAGKFPKMERQPLRLLESYGLAATSFNRF